MRSREVRTLTGRYGFRAAALIALAFGVLGAMSCNGARYGGKIYEVAYAARDNDAVATVNGRILATEELGALEGRAGGRGGHTMGVAGGGHDEAAKQPLGDLVDQELVVQYAVGRGVPARGRDRDTVDLFYIAMRGMDYYGSALVKNVKYDSREIADFLPRKWLLGKFEFVLFPGMDEARKAAKTVRTAADFQALKRKHPDRYHATQEIYPSSGFFSRYDDIGLYNRGAGEVYGPAETGLGAAIVFIDVLRTPTPEEVEKLLLGIRQSLDERYLGTEVERIKKAHGFKPDRDAILKYVKAYRNGEFLDIPLGKIDSFEVTSGQMRWLSENDPAGYLKNLAPEGLVPYYEGLMSNVSFSAAMGEEARKANVRDFIDARYAASFNNFKRRFYYAKGLELGIGGFDVSDAEARKYYAENLAAKFTTPERVHVAHIFSRDRRKLDGLVERLRRGESFEELARRYSEDKQSAENGGNVGWVMRDGGTLPEIEENAFRHNPGDITPVVKTARGYHILKILERKPAEVVSFESAAGSIRDILSRARYEEKKRKFLDELRSKARIETFPQRAADFAKRG